MAEPAPPAVAAPPQPAHPQQQQHTRNQPTGDAPANNDTATNAQQPAAAPLPLATVFVVNNPAPPTPVAPLSLPFNSVDSLLPPVAAASAHPPHFPAISQQQQLLRTLTAHIFLLRSDVLEVFERWAQLSDLPSDRAAGLNPLYNKLLQKQSAIEQALQSLNSIGRQIAFDRLERGKRAGNKRTRSVLGYEALRVQGDDSHSHSNVNELRSLHVIHGNVSHAMHALAREFQLRFPFLTQSLHTVNRVHTQLQSLAHAHSRSQPQSQSLTVKSIISMALHYFHRQQPNAPEPAKIEDVYDSEGNVRALVVMMPPLMRVAVSLDAHSLTMTRINCLGWHESLSLADSDKPSSLPLFRAVTAQLTQVLHYHSNAHNTLPNSVLSSSFAHTHANILPSLLALRAVLVHISYYSNLLLVPCQSCGRSLQYVDDTSGLQPPVVRTIDRGLPLHVHCVDAFQLRVGSASETKEPAAQTQSQPQNQTQAAAPTSA